MTPSDILEEFRVVIASLPLARDPSKTFRRYAGRERFAASAASRADAFHVESRTHDFLEGFGTDGQSESEMTVAVLLGHSPSGTEAQREDWAARECAMVADVLERHAWATPGVGAVFLSQPGSTDRTDGDSWVSELLFRVVYVASDVPAGDLPGYTPPPVRLDADHVTVAAIEGLEASDVQAALAVLFARVAAAVLNTGDQLINGLKTFVAGIALQAKLSITGVPSGEHAIEIPAGSRVQLGDGANGYLYGAGNTIITPGAISAAQVTLATTTGIVATTWASIRGNYAPAALRVGSLVALTGNIFELYSDSFATLKAYFDKNGGLHTAASVVPITDGVGSLGSSTNRWLEAYATNFRGDNLVDTGGNFRVRFGNAATTQVIGGQADGVAAVGVTSDTKDAYNTLGAKIHSFRTAGVEKGYVSKDGTIFGYASVIAGTNLLTNSGVVQRNATAGALSINGTNTDGANSVGVIINNTVALTAAGAKIASFRNAGTENASFDKDGKLTISGVGTSQDAISIPQGSRLNLGNGNRYLYDNGVHVALAPNVSLSLTGGIVDGNISRIATPINGSLSFRSNVPDAANSVVCFTDNLTALTTAGALLHSFRNATIEKARVDKDGNFENLVAGEGVILKSPNGTRYKLTVADDGTLTTAAV